MDVTELFLRHAEPAVRAAFREDPELASAFQRLVTTGASSWPDLAMPVDVFVRFLAQLLSAADVSQSAFQRMHIRDLYLACAYGLSVGKRKVPLRRRRAPNALPTLPAMRGTEGSAAKHPPHSDKHSATATPTIAAYLNNIARRLMALGTLQCRGFCPISAYATPHSTARRMSMAGWGAV